MGLQGLFLAIMACCFLMATSQSTDNTGTADTSSSKATDSMTATSTATTADARSRMSAATNSVDSSPAVSDSMSPIMTTTGEEENDVTNNEVTSGGMTSNEVTSPGVTSNEAIHNEMTTGTGNSPAEDGGGRFDEENGDRQPLEPPVWTQCLSDATPEELSGTDIISVFKVWCSNYNAIIECLSRDLPANAFSNPFDFFVYLNFDPVQMQNKSQLFCSRFEGVSSQLTCASTANETLSEACGHFFSSRLFHIFDIYNHRDVPQGVLEEIACDVTTQTTFCLRQTFPDCEDETVSAVLNYYALFTNDSCVAQLGEVEPHLPPKEPETVIVKCANEAAQSLTPEQSEAQPTTLVDFVILRLKADCTTYEPRYACYNRELSNNITNFLDFWLSMTFDYDNARASQQSYCAQIEDAIIPQLTNECFNQSQPGLVNCEAGFSKEVETIRQELLENTEGFDRVELQTLACRTSVTRAVCLGNAMKHCGDDVANAMANSEMGILPDICRQLLVPQNSPAAGDQEPEAGTHQEGSSQSEYAIQTGPNESHGGKDHDRESIRESKNADGNPDTKSREGQRDRPVNDMGISDNATKYGKEGEMTQQNDKDQGKSSPVSKSTSDDNMDDGVGAVRTNLITFCLVLSFVLSFMF